LNDKLKKLLDDAEDEELWSYFGSVQGELKKRGHLRSGNVTGERGEMVAINFYNNTRNEPKLQRALTGTKNIDATSRDGERYAIKSVKTKTSNTGTFQADDFTKQRFDYLIVVRLDEFYNPIEILEATWKTVNELKRFDKTMKAYKMPLTKKNIMRFRRVYPKK